MKKVLFALMLVGVLATGCGTTSNEIEKALKLCENNGGLDRIYHNRQVLCNNGAVFSE